MLLDPSPSSGINLIGKQYVDSPTAVATMTFLKNSSEPLVPNLLPQYAKSFMTSALSVLALTFRLCTSVFFSGTFLSVHPSVHLKACSICQQPQDTSPDSPSWVRALHWVPTAPATLFNLSHVIFIACLLISSVNSLRTGANLIHPDFSSP